MGKGGGFIEYTFSRIFYIPVGGVFMYLITKSFYLFNYQLPIFLLVAISMIGSFLIVNKITDFYYSENRIEYIIHKYEKPGWTRYLIFLIVLFGGITFGIVCFKRSISLYHTF